MTRDDKVYKIKENIIKEIEELKRNFENNLKNVAFIDNKFTILKLSALYYIESYVKLDTSFVDKSLNGNYIIDDEAIDILLNMDQIIIKIFSIMDIMNENLGYNDMDNVNNAYYHISEFIIDGFFQNTVVSIFDRLL